MTVLPRPARPRAIRTNLNILPSDLRAPAPSLVDVSLVLVLLVGLLLLFAVFQVKTRADAFQYAQQMQLAAAQAAVARLSSPEGVQLRSAWQDAQFRLRGVADDFEDIAAHKVRWSMAIRALGSHPQVRVDEITQAPRSLNLVVKGVANNDAVLMEYARGLRSSGIFADVRLASIGGIAGSEGSPIGLTAASSPSVPSPGGDTNPMAGQPAQPQPTSQPPVQLRPTKPSRGPFIPTPPVPGGVGPALPANGAGPGLPEELPTEEIAAGASATAAAAGTPTPMETSSAVASALATGTGSVTPSLSPTAGYEFTVVSQQATYITPDRDSGTSMPGTISGKLIDAAGQLVPGAVFRIESYGSPMWTADSPSAGQGASNGTFAFTSLRRATYRVYVVSSSSQAAVDLHVGTDGTRGFNTWEVVFRKNAPGTYGYWGSVTPTMTGSPTTATPTETATPTATPTFAEPIPSHSNRETALDITQQAIWWDCICSSGNEDWFKINVPARGSRLSVTMGQGDSFGLFIVDPTGQGIVIQDLSASQTKTVSWDIGDSTGYWYVRVSAVTYGYYSNTPYFLSPLVTQPTALPTATPSATNTPLPGANCAIEQTNTSLANAFWLYTPPTRGQICFPGGKAYFYKFLANPGSTFEVELTQPQPLTLSLYGYAGDFLATAAYQPTPKPLTISRAVPTAPPGSPPTFAYTYTVRVASPSSTGSLDSWELYLTNGFAPTPTVTHTPTATATPTPSPTWTPSKTPTNAAGQLDWPGTTRSTGRNANATRHGFSMAVLEPAGGPDGVPPAQPTPLPPLLFGPVAFPTPRLEIGPSLPATGAASSLGGQPSADRQLASATAPQPASALALSSRPVSFVMILTMHPAGGP